MSCNPFSMRKRRKRALRGEEDHAHLRARVLDRKVQMSGGGAHEVRHLALHRDIVVAKEIEVDLPDQLAHCVDALSHGYGASLPTVRQAHCSSMSSPMTAHSYKEPGKMKTETFLRKLSVVLTAAILIVGVSACASPQGDRGAGLWPGPHRGVVHRSPPAVIRSSVPRPRPRTRKMSKARPPRRSSPVRPRSTAAAARTPAARSAQPAIPPVPA